MFGSGFSGSFRPLSPDHDCRGEERWGEDVVYLCAAFSFVRAISGGSRDKVRAGLYRSDVSPDGAGDPVEKSGQLFCGRGYAEISARQGSPRNGEIPGKPDRCTGGRHGLL